MDGRFVTICQFAVSSVVVFSSTYPAALNGQLKTVESPFTTIVSEGFATEKNRTFSMVSVAFVEVPPRNPKNSSFVVPAQGDTSIRGLAEIAFVGMYFASNVNRLDVPIPHTSTSSTGFPSTLKSNAIPVAFAGN